MKNKGYTLIEALIVLAIMAIALTLTLLSVNNIFALDVRQTSRELVSELGKEKLACMSRTGDVYMHLYKTNAGVFVDKYENDILTEQGIHIGKKAVTIVWKSASNTSGTALDAAGIYIAFNRSDGSFMTIGQAARLFNPTANPPYSGDYYTALDVSSGVRTATIVLGPQTGRATFS